MNVHPHPNPGCVNAPFRGIYARCMPWLGFRCGKPLPRTSIISATHGQPILFHKGRSIADLHQRAVKRRCVALAEAPAVYNIAEDSDFEPHDCISNPIAIISTSSSSSSRAQEGATCNQSAQSGRLQESSHPTQFQHDISLSVQSSASSRNVSAANLDDIGATRALPKSEATHPERPPKRKLLGPYRSDPEARASHSRRARTDPLVSLQPLREAPFDPFLGLPRSTQHPNTIVEPDN